MVILGVLPLSLPASQAPSACSLEVVGHILWELPGVCWEADFQDLPV